MAFILVSSMYKQDAIMLQRPNNRSSICVGLSIGLLKGNQLVTQGAALFAEEQFIKNGSLRAPQISQISAG